MKLDRKPTASLEHSGQAWEPSRLPDLSDLPPFRQHRLIRGGHLQTVLSLRAPAGGPSRPVLHWLTLDDGDQLALHEDLPECWRSGDPSVMIVHGLCGCRTSPYMIRLANHFVGRGVRVFRLEMRGCGVGKDRSHELTHAGRSDDCLAALARIAELTEAGPIAAIGVSLGGNQLLRAAGLIGSGERPRPNWLPRWNRLVAVSPPVDLARCSENLERPMLRGYNRYFIRHLLSRLPEPIRRSDDKMKRFSKPWPKTLRELDERITAPLSGFDGALDYYTRSSALPVIPEIEFPTLILTAHDDPIVPVDCFRSLAPALRSHPAVKLLITPGGGHVGFFARGEERFYMDRVIDRWCRWEPTP